MADSTNHRWSGADILDAIADGLAKRIELDDAAQSVRGIDSLDELGLHPLIRDGLGRAGYGVWPEQRYPLGRRNRRRSEGDRCDIVLTSDQLPLKHPDAEETLFEPSEAMALVDACWLEVKTVTQFTEEGANPAYSAGLGRTLRADVVKLARDEHIRFAGLVLVMFTNSQEVAEHDLMVWWERMAEAGHVLGYPMRRNQDLTDRLGNRACAVFLIPVKGL